MIIGNLNIIAVAFSPPKTYSPLVVDANAVLTGAYSGKFFETISRGNSQVV
jgi:hypothetical protein